MLLKLRATTWRDVGRIRHEMIRSVNQRLRAEGIELK